jgi:hypothetical protein
MIMRQLTVLKFFKQTLGARNRVGIGLSYLPARLHTSLVELVPWNRFLGSLKVSKFGLGILNFLEFKMSELVLTRVYLIT